MGNNEWEDIYARGEQLNKYPFSEVVSFYFRNRPEFPKRELFALDIGCGSGVHSAFLAANGCRTLGIDFSQSAVNAARILHQDPKIEFRSADLSKFAPLDMSFDLIVDRCSSTHSTIPIVEELYSRLRSAMAPGARVYWQGFAWDNSGRTFGTDNGDGSWGNFSKGVFEPLGRTAFFTEANVRRIFSGFQIRRLRHISDRDMETGYNHASWIVEAENAH